MGALVGERAARKEKSRNFNVPSGATADFWRETARR